VVLIVGAARGGEDAGVSAAVKDLSLSLSGIRDNAEADEEGAGGTDSLVSLAVVTGITDKGEDSGV
jgi:hypothetical protein